MRRGGRGRWYYCTALPPGHPQDEAERDRWQHGPRHFGAAPRTRQLRVVRDDRGPEGGAKDEELRHDDACDAREQKHGRKHGGNLTRPASAAWGRSSLMRTVSPRGPRPPTRSSRTITPHAQRTPSP